MFGTVIKRFPGTAVHYQNTVLYRTALFDEYRSYGLVAKISN